MSRSRFITPAAMDNLGDGAEAGPLRELALHRWIDRVLRNHTADRVLDRLLDAVLDGLSIRFGLLGHINEDGELRVLTQRPPNARSSGAPSTELLIPAETWATPLAPTREGHSMRIEGPLPLPGGFAESAQLAAAPLVRQGEVMGMLVAGPRNGGRKHDLDLLEAAASRATFVVDAAVHREAQRRRVSTMQMQLLQSQRMEAIGQLAGGIAHDFNNLLTAILGYCNMMAFDLDDTSPMHADLLEVRKAADRAASLTKQLLTFSRRQPRKPQLVDVNEIIEGLEPMLRRLLVETVQMSTDLAPTLGHVCADPTQLERVLINLVVNARDAMPDGGRLHIQTRNLELTRTDEDHYLGLDPGHYIQLSVADSGEGMDSDTQLRVFEPFFTTKPEGKGTGLGLATVYGVIKQANGSIWIDSSPDTGSTFRICLPRHRGGDDTERDPESGQYASPYRGRETILLVEDDASVMVLTRRILERFGYSVLTAVNATSALRLATKYDGPIHALLTDVVMPGASGPKLAASIAGLRPHTQIMYMSGHPDEELGLHVPSSDRAPLITKPFKPLELARALRKLLDG